MSICGKGDLPGCRFFTTGGCVSPFNCIYKIELDFHTGATSNATEISRNAEIARPTAENAELRERLKEAEHRAEVAERQAVVLSKWLAEKTRKDYPWQAWLDAAQKQAEKEIEEE